MKYLTCALVMMASAAAFLPDQASAAVCADGVWRAGCAGPRGAVVVKKPKPVVVKPAPVVVAPVVVAPVVVAPVCTIVNGVRVCR